MFIEDDNAWVRQHRETVRRMADSRCYLEETAPADRGAEAFAARPTKRRIVTMEQAVGTTITITRPLA